MNDRGQRLTSLDMLKSYLVGRARRYAGDVHEAWRGNLVALGDLDPDAPADLVKFWMRARYAQDAADNEAIDTAVHQWVRRHSRVIGLHRPVDYRDFAADELRHAADRYRRLLAAADRLTPGLEPVFYNAFNKVPAQFPLILSALHDGDGDAEFVAKARQVAGFVDVFVARSMLSYQDFRQATVWRRIMSLTRELRRLSTEDIGVRLAAELEALAADLGPTGAFGLRQRNRAHVRYLLARLTSWVDQQCGVEHDFAWYACASANPYEIEHVLAHRVPEHGPLAGLSGKAFAELRNRFGALVLLPKSTNAGFGALPYERKLPLYASQNLLARSLHPGCYDRNPAFLHFVEESGLPFQPYPDGFDERAIVERQHLYRRIAARVWDPAAVGLSTDGASRAAAADPVAPRQRTVATMTLTDLLSAGMLRPGRLVGEHLGVEYVAELTPHGTVRLDTGAEFASPSAAAMTALDRPSWNGWTFWAVQHASGDRTRLEVIRRAALAAARGAPTDRPGAADLSDASLSQVEQELSGSARLDAGGQSGLVDQAA
jgi:hypothetical protein